MQAYDPEPKVIETFELPPDPDPRHVYRLLRYAFLYDDNPETGNLFVNELLIRAGFARSQYLQPNRLYLRRLQTAEREAEADKAGLWAECDPRRDEPSSGREEASDPLSEECVVKGNINKKYEKEYFVPGCPNYTQVKIDPRKGETWFCSEEEARAAGWRKSGAC